MNKRNLFRLSALVAVSLALFSDRALAQLDGDVAGVKAASQEFYKAILVLDDGGAAMSKILAHTPYITFPRGQSWIVGYDTFMKFWVDISKLFSGRETTLSDQRIHVNGNMAWEVGHETGMNYLKNGRQDKVDWFVTNVYEKLDGRWQIVAHHVQPRFAQQAGK